VDSLGVWQGWTDWILVKIQIRIWMWIREFFNHSSPLRDLAKNDIVLYSMIFQKCIGPDMFSWIRHYVLEVCALPSVLVVIITYKQISVYDGYGGQDGSQYSVMVVYLDVLCRIHQLSSYWWRVWVPMVVFEAGCLRLLASTHSAGWVTQTIWHIHGFYITSINRLTTWQDKSRKCWVKQTSWTHGLS